MTTVYVLAGPPGSGKSTWSRQKRKESDVYCQIFESDAYRLDMFGTLDSGIQNQKHHASVFGKMRKDLLNQVKYAHDTDIDIDLIYDATNIGRRRRIALYNEIKSKDKDAKVVVVVFYKLLEELFYTNEHRAEKEQVPIAKLKERYINMQPPRVGVDCDDMELVGTKLFEEDGQGAYSPTNLFRFEIGGFYTNLPHNNHHHKETIRQHINMCVEASKHNWLIQEVAEFHDLGKFVSRTWDDRGFHTYKGHANLSAMYHFNVAFEEIKSGNRDYAMINEAILRHMDAHQGIGTKSILRNKLDDDTLALIEIFKEIDNASKLQ